MLWIQIRPGGLGGNCQGHDETDRGTEREKSNPDPARESPEVQSATPIPLIELAGQDSDAADSQ